MIVKVRFVNDVLSVDVAFVCELVSWCFCGDDHDSNPLIRLIECLSGGARIQALDSIENLIEVSWDMLGIPLKSALLDIPQLGEVRCEFVAQKCRRVCEFLAIWKRRVIALFGLVDISERPIGIPARTRLVRPVEWMWRQRTPIDEIDTQPVLDWFDLGRVCFDIVNVVGMRYGERTGREIKRWQALVCRLDLL
jgi:hypothetical protein